MRWRNLIAAGLVGAVIASAALSRDHTHEHGGVPLPIPKIVYTIRADVVPESLLVRGDMELEYRNFSDDTLSEIHFRLDLNAHPPDDYCRIDSILYYGAPLGEDEISVDDAFMKVLLPSRLAPGATGFFLIAFQSRLAPRPPLASSTGGHVRFSRWYPRICPYKDGRWHHDRYRGHGRSAGEYARYNVALQIDSAYSIVHPGELLNEKEHYGLLPKRAGDTVYVDLMHRHSRGFGEARYYPEFPSSFKRYFVRARNATDFSFVVGPEFIRDRTYRDSLTIEVCYHNEAGKVWAGFVARSTVNLIGQYEKRLGRFPYNYLTVVAGEPDEYRRSQQLIVLPADIADSRLLYAALAVEIADCWFSPVLPDSSGAGRWLGEGLACYVAIRALYDSLGVEGYETIRKHRTLLTNLFDEKEWSRQFIAMVFHEIPSQVHGLRFAVGDMMLSKALREYARRFRYELPDAGDFLDIIEELTGRSPGISLDKWASEGSHFDFGVSRMKTEPAQGGYEVSFQVKNFGSTVMPVEVAYVISATDTIYDTLQYGQLPGPGGSFVFRKTVPGRPKAVALDPNHYLPDADRGNNYAFSLPVRFRYHTPETLFPPFDDLR